MRTLPLLILAGLPLALPAVATAQAVRTVPVTVVNPVQATEDVDNPAFQPASGSETNSTDISGPGVTLLFTGAYGDPVPAGKRLVVQHLSASLSSAGLEADPICTVNVREGVFTSVSHPVPVQVLDSGNQLYARFSMPITLYAEPGEEVGVSCSVRVSDDTSIQMAYTGYLVDLD